MYENYICEVQNCMREDHRTYVQNSCSYKKRAGKKIPACMQFEPLL